MENWIGLSALECDPRCDLGRWPRLGWSRAVGAGEKNRPYPLDAASLKQRPYSSRRRPLRRESDGGHLMLPEVLSQRRSSHPA